MEKGQNALERNLKRFRRWLCENAVARVINGFLPTFLDDHSRKIKVAVNDSMHPCTDGDTIYVSLIPQFLDDGYSEEEWLMTLKVAASHEAQHVNSSNFTDIKEIQEWYGPYLADKYELDPAIGRPIARKALNIVEDGRIERIAVLRRPGMYLPFRFFNDVLRDSTAIDAVSDTPAGEYEDFWNNILSYAKTGLYSPGIEVYAGSELEAVTLGVQSLIDDGIASNSSDKCRCLVQELLEDVSPYIVSLIKADPDLVNTLKEQEVKDEYTSNKGEPAQGAAASGSNSLRASSSEGRDEKEDKKGANSEGGEGGNSEEKDSKDDSYQTGFSSSDKKLEPLSESEMEEIKKQMEREMTAANREENASKEKPDSDSPSNSDIESIRANYTGKTLPIRYTTIPIAGRDELTAEMKAQALSLRREITRIQEARSNSRKGLRRGTLDTGSLWKTGLQEDTIFSRKGKPNAGSVVFYLDIDNSGSMANDDSAGSVRKYQAARAAAAVIEEALKGIVPCKIALFNQELDGVYHTVVKGFDDNKNANCSWNSLSAIGTGGCNMDSVNIRISASELSRRSEGKKILIVLSDGKPTAYGSRSEALAEVRQAVFDARRKGIIVIPIMFGDDRFLKSSMAAYELMYEKNIIACEPKDITNRLCALFRQIISR